jgi:hypothetical protein
VRKPQPFSLHECEALVTLRHIYLESFSWTLRTLDVWVWGHCGTSLEGQGSHDSGPVRGHKGPIKKPYVHQDRKGSTHTYYLHLHHLWIHFAADYWGQTPWTYSGQGIDIGGTAENVINKAYRPFLTCKGTFGKTWGMKLRVVHWIYTMAIRPVLT